MAEGVVVLLEAVEVEEPEQQGPLRGRARELGTEIVLERSAVGQPVSGSDSASRRLASSSRWFWV